MNNHDAEKLFQFLLLNISRRFSSLPFNPTILGEPNIHDFSDILMIQMIQRPIFYTIYIYIYIYDDMVCFDVTCVNPSQVFTTP